MFSLELSCDIKLFYHLTLTEGVLLVCEQKHAPPHLGVHCNTTLIMMQWAGQMRFISVFLLSSLSTEPDHQISKTALQRFLY